MSRHTKEKRRRQKQKIEAEVKEDRIVFDVFGLLRDENTDTKPNMAKFLKEYVKSISGNPRTKPVFYPAPDAPINKYFVKFMDDHELILDVSQASAVGVYFEYGVDEVEIGPREEKLAREFMAKLFDFGFLPGGDDRGRSIADRIRGSEPRGAGSIPAGPTIGEAEYPPVFQSAEEPESGREEHAA